MKSLHFPRIKHAITQYHEWYFVFVCFIFVLGACRPMETEPNGHQPGTSGNMILSSNRENTRFYVRAPHVDQLPETGWRLIGTGQDVTVDWPSGQPIEIKACRDGAKPISTRLTEPIPYYAFNFFGSRGEADTEGAEPQVQAVEHFPADNNKPSLDPEVYSSGQARTGSGDIWVLAVGISQYASSETSALNNLSFAAQDAQGFVKEICRTGVPFDHTRLLTDETATKQDIGYGLETWLRRAGPEDLIVLFWSSHAWPDPADPTKAYFACYDSRPSDPSSGWRMDRVREILEERQARNVVLIADTCHAGKIIRAGDPKAIGIIPSLEKMKEDQDIPKGWVFIASADPDRKAYEDKAWQNGALTHCLLEGLSGKADGYQSLGLLDGIVTLGELRGFVTDRMAEESLSVLGAKLMPLFYTTSGDPGIWNLSLQAGE